MKFDSDKKLKLKKNENLNIIYCIKMNDNNDIQQIVNINS